MSTKNAKKGSRRGVSVTGLMDASKIQFARNNRSTVYQPLFDQMAKLRPAKGKNAFEVKSEGRTPRQLHNRVNAALKRCPTKPPKGHHFVKGTTTDGGLAVMLLPTGKHKPAAPAPQPAAKPEAPKAE